MGELILVTGFFGAGKTTLAESACRNIPNLEYFTTVTTRPPRPYDTVFPGEYNFVDEPTYNQLRAKSKNWDHGEFHGHYYGQDIEAAQDKLKEGKSLLRCVLSDTEVIERIAHHFLNQTVLVWVDTPLEVANERLSKLNDKLRTERVDGPLQTDENRSNVKPTADYVFEPASSIEEDATRFEQFMVSIMNKEPHND